MNTAVPKPAPRRSSLQPGAAAIIKRFDLRCGACYRIAYAVGQTGDRRLARSIAEYVGVSERRLWSGEVAPCLEFALPHGRPLSVLATQLVDAKSARRNAQGHWVLQADEPRPADLRTVRGRQLQGQRPSAAS